MRNCFDHTLFDHTPGRWLKAVDAGRFAGLPLMTQSFFPKIHAEQNVLKKSPRSQTHL
jgi:hypothetical protein